MTEVEATNEAGTESRTQEAKPKATRAPHKPHVAPKKGQSAKKATPRKQAPKSAKKAASRADSKKGQVIALLQKAKGATLAACGGTGIFQAAHSVWSCKGRNQDLRAEVAG